MNEAIDPEFENVLEHSNSDISLSLYVENDNKIWEARKKRESAGRGMELVKDQFKTAELDDSKENPQKVQIEATSVERRMENSKKSENRFQFIKIVMSATRDLVL